MAIVIATMKIKTESECQSKALDGNYLKIPETHRSPFGVLKLKYSNEGGERKVKKAFN